MEGGSRWISAHILVVDWNCPDIPQRRLIWKKYVPVATEFIPGLQVVVRR
jgi:hypothetical protein